MSMDLRIFTDKDGVVTGIDKHTGGVGSIKGFNPDTDRILAYTNAKVLELNTEMAKHLGLPKEFSKDEVLSMNGIECSFTKGVSSGIIYPSCISKGKLMEGDKLQLAMQKTSNDIDKYGTDISMYDKATVLIGDRLYTIYYDPNHYHSQKMFKSAVDRAQAMVYDNNEIPEDVKLKDWCGQNKSAKGVRERGKAWSEFIAHSNLVFNLQRPFATTIHKSQGSEFSTVYIAQSDIKKSIRNGYYVTYARLMYVALSRAINRVIII